MNGDELSCECPEGFDEPFCSKPEESEFYCDLNACKNGGICGKVLIVIFIHMHDRNFY